MCSVRCFLVLGLMAWLALIIFTGCSSKPSKSEIEAAVRSELQSEIPLSWVGDLLGGRNARISRIEIEQWGIFNEEQKYWPVRIRVVGSAELNNPFSQAKVKDFDKVAEFRFRRDDYGKWEASLSGGMFQ